jgi:hypothetical protein
MFAWMVNEYAQMFAQVVTFTQGMFAWMVAIL